MVLEEGGLLVLQVVAAQETLQARRRLKETMVALGILLLTQITLAAEAVALLAQAVRALYLQLQAGLAGTALHQRFLDRL